METESDLDLATVGGDGSKKVLEEDLEAARTEDEAAPRTEDQEGEVVKEYNTGWRQRWSAFVKDSREILVPACPPTLFDSVQYAMELAGLIIVFSIMFTLVPSETRQLLWWLPFVGIFGACISMSTPAGGGVLYFPALNVAGRSVDDAIGFSIAAQAVGMGIYGITNWLRKDKEAIKFKSIAPVAVFGFGGTALGLFVLHFNPGVLRIIFGCFALLLAIYIVVGVFVFQFDNNAGRLEVIYRPREWNLAALKTWGSLLAMGLIGGIFVGWFGTGLDVVYFFVTTLFYRMNPHPATVSSIVLMGIVAWFGFIVRAAQQQIPWGDLIMVLPGIILGARVGPVLNLLLGKRAVLIFFSLLLVLEFARTMHALATGTIFTNSTGV